MASPSAAEFVPDTDDLTVLSDASQNCKGCDLYRNATQAVFGGGSRDATVVLVGEQPGEQEDKAGQPFVGPAGRLLDKALVAAGIDRERVYITNAVKHFKFRERGKRRIHDTPKKSEVDACFPWLAAELRLVRPRVLVILGATAGKALLGSSFRLTAWRGREIESGLAPYVTATIHPAAILRAPDDAGREAERRAFASDLAAVAKRLS
jgi:uracil-DNA glycosylase